MADLDRNVLEDSGLTMAEVANCLGISRQAVAKQIAASDKNFFTQARADQVLAALRALRTPKHTAAAEAFLLAVKQRLDISVSVGTASDDLETMSASTQIKAKEFWILSDQPLELEQTRSGFLEFMQEHAFQDPSILAVYFVSSQTVAEELCDAFDSAARLLTEEGKSFQARVLVIATNMVVGMPHTLVLNPGSKFITLPRDEVATGWVLVGRNRDQFVRLPDRTTKSIVQAVQAAKIGNQSYKVENFFPSVDDDGYANAKNLALRFKLIKQYPTNQTLD